jgi:hypothetical protein
MSFPQHEALVQHGRSHTPSSPVRSNTHPYVSVLIVKLRDCVHVLACNLEHHGQNVTSLSSLIVHISILAASEHPPLSPPITLDTRQQNLSHWITQL